MAKKLYYANTGHGALIVGAEDEHDAYDKILREVGTASGVMGVREATEKDIAWVRRTGGYVPVEE